MVGSGAVAFLRRHPVVALLLLSPGIPEYLSSSSPLNAIVLNPPQFLFQAAANLGLYGPGVLLVREAAVRWKKGWGTILLLGAAYGILEEGVALSTLFDPKANPVGTLGTYGHWVGVNWVWVASIVPVHMIFSISIPIMMLGLALPETAGRGFLGGRKLPAALAILVVDVSLLFLLIFFGTGFWMGWPVLVGSLAIIGALVYAGRRAGLGAVRSRTSSPRAGPRRMAVLGAAFYPCVLLAEGIPQSVGVAAFVDFFLVILLQGVFLMYVLRVVGSVGNERNKVALATGLILPIAAIGLIAEATLPLNLVADVIWFLAFRKVWRKYAPPGPAPLALVP
ncbi:MAG TPA: hypothetical protein VEB67_00920 [Nitrososphaerales archaeon]|nr:hypothetical protein [Nitrososphaerales archaeon]